MHDPKNCLICAWNRGWNRFWGRKSKTDEREYEVINLAGVLAGVLHSGECWSGNEFEFAKLQLATITEPLAIHFEDLTPAGVAVLAALLAQKLIPLYPVTIHPDELKFYPSGMPKTERNASWLEGWKAGRQNFHQLCPACLKARALWLVRPCSRCAMTYDPPESDVRLLFEAALSAMCKAEDEAVEMPDSSDRDKLLAYIRRKQAEEVALFDQYYA